MLGAKLLDGVVDMVEKRDEVSFAAEKPRNAADANEAASITDRLDRLIGLAAIVLVQRCTGGVARHYRARRGFRRFETRPPPAVSHVNDDAQAVQLRDRDAAEIAQAAVVRFAAAVAQR